MAVAATATASSVSSTTQNSASERDHPAGAVVIHVPRGVAEQARRHEVATEVGAHPQREDGDPTESGHRERLQRQARRRARRTSEQPDHPSNECTQPRPPAGPRPVADTARMDERGDGPPRPPPDAAAIRRALAECMTLGDIDDAMGWATGTARRRRWRDPDAGGLPPADAELGGVPLWFRATIIGWDEHEDPPPAVGHSAEPDTATRAEGDAGPEVGPEAEPQPVTSGAGAESDAGANVGADLEAESGAPTGADADVGAGAEPDSGADVRVGPGREPPGAGRIDTGFSLSAGQDVQAFVQGAWHPATVVSRDRRTVVVDYQLAPGPLGARRQRVTLERIRVPDAQPPDPGR